jgi:hypothetical protein
MIAGGECFQGKGQRFQQKLLAKLRFGVDARAHAI